MVFAVASCILVRKTRTAHPAPWAALGTKFRSQSCACVFSASRASRWPIVHRLDYRDAARPTPLRLDPPEKLTSDLWRALSTQQVGQLEVYFSRLQYWNDRINLTAIRDKKDIHTKHIEDCLSILPLVRTLVERKGKGPVEVADIGSGAGLPGIILAIAEPAWCVTLVETRINKCRFLQTCIEDVGLRNVRVAKCRAEDFCMDGSPEIGVYDVVTARAVADVAILAGITLPVAKQHGRVICMKGPPSVAKVEVERAKDVISRLGGVVDGIVPLTIPGLTTSVTNPKFEEEKTGRKSEGALCGLGASSVTLGYEPSQRSAVVLSHQD